MVKLIPVLVSNSVSRNIVPGILKSIESFTMIYDLDQILNDAAKGIGISKQSKVIRNKVVIKEGKDEIVNFLTNEILLEQPARHGGGTKTPEEEAKTAYARGVGSGAAQQQFQRSPGEEEEMSYRKGLGSGRAQQQFQRSPGEEEEMSYRKGVGAARAKQEAEPETDEQEKAKLKARGSEIGKREIMPKDASVSIGQFDMKTISLDPSWMKADLLTKKGEKYSTLIGVKAIPVAVKSDAKLHELIMWDSQIGRIMQLIISSGRKWEGFLYRLWSRTAGRIFNSDPTAISGNPYKDIVLKRTIISSKYLNRVYFVLNRADLSKDFFEQAKRVRQLTRLGWQSFVIADDVNKSVSFCMTQFKGMCSTMPYGMLYQTLNQAKVFDDLEDVRRSSASLFRTRRPFKKIIGEALAQQKLQEFSAEIFSEPEYPEILNEMELLDENFGQFTKKIVNNPKVAISRLFKQTIKLPTIAPERVAKFSNKIDPDFYKSYKLSKKVITNSLTKVQNEALISWASLFVVIRGLTVKSGKNLMYGTRETLKYLIPKLRKLIKESTKTTLNIPPEHMIQVVFGTTILLSIASLIGWMITSSIRSSFEIMRHFKAAEQGLLQGVKNVAIKTKTYISAEGGNGTKIVNDAQNIAKDIVEKGQEIKQSEEQLLTCIAVLMVTLGIVLAIKATLKEK